MRRTRCLWPCGLGLIALSLLAYMAGVAGVFDAVLIEPSRSAALEQVDAAASRRPADVAFLMRTLHGPDRLVGESAAWQLQGLLQAGELTEQQAQLLQRSLLGLLGEHGNWWRFGWDSDEPETEGFRSAVVAVLASFGSGVLPDLARVLEEGGPSARGDACGVGIEMLRMGTADEEMISAALGERVGELSRSDSDPFVRVVCGQLDRLLGDETTQ